MTTESRLRVVSWNINFRVGESARRQAVFLRSLDPRPDLVLLQEVNPTSASRLCELAGLDWIRCAVQMRKQTSHEHPLRRHGVAIAGRRKEAASFEVMGEF